MLSPLSPDPEVNCVKKDGKPAPLVRVTFVAAAIRNDGEDPKFLDKFGQRGRR